MIPKTVEELKKRLEYMGQIYSEGEHAEILEKGKWKKARVEWTDFLYDDDGHVVLGNNIYKIKKLEQLTLFENV